jgi:hypothetical protein
MTDYAIPYWAAMVAIYFFFLALLVTRELLASYLNRGSSGFRASSVSTENAKGGEG